MKKITVLYIIDGFIDMAGSERNLFEIVTHLDKNKYKAIVWYLRGKDSIDEFNHSGIQTRNLQIKKIYGLNMIKKSIQLINFIKKERVQIVVTYHKSSDFWGGIIARLAGVPVVISSRRDMGHNLKKRHFFLYKLINNLIFDKIITVSDAVKNMLIKKQNALSKKIITIYNGVDLQKFSGDFCINRIKNDLKLDLNKPIVGILADLRRIKGHKYFLEAAYIILKRIPDVQFLIVGWQDDIDYVLELKEFAQALGIKQNVIFTGSRLDVREMLSIMDISVISSLKEGFSNAILESMSMGKPVVATNVGGNPEAIVDGNSGFLVPPKDARSLANAICCILENKQLAKDMGIVGRKRTEDIFSLQEMIDKTEKLYDVELKKKTSKGKTLNRILKNSEIRTKIIRLFKTSLSAVLYYLGMIYLFRKISSRLLGKNNVKILAYHKINDDSPNYLGLSVTVSSFEKQIKYLKRNYDLISLDEAVHLIQTKQKFLKDTMVITFDDGFKDNYINAFPIIKKYNIPATIFLAVEPVGFKKNLWFENIIDMITKTNKDSIDLKAFGLVKYLIKTIKQKEKVVTTIIKYAKQLDKVKRQKLIKYISKELEVNADESNQMLSWEEIIEMKENSVSFGAHTMSHSILTTIPIKETEYEILESKRVIEEKLKQKVSFFAYPNGSAKDFNQEIIEILKNSGFSCACTLIAGVNNTDIFTLRRRCMSENFSKGVLGSFSKSLFAVEMAGVFDFLRMCKIKFKRVDYA